MIEDDKTNIQDDKLPDDDNTQDDIEFSPDEERAMSLGWQPKDKWDGDPEDWVTARQFLKRGELFERINSYKHKITSLEKTVGTLVKHNEQVYNAGFQDAIKELKAERRVALQEGDAEKVEEIEEKIDELRENHEKETQARQQEVASAQPQVSPEFVEWNERNTWYGRDVVLSGYADGVAKEIILDAQAKGAQVDQPKMLQEVARMVRNKFPEKFGRNEGRRSSVNNERDDGASGAGRGRSKNKDDDVIANMSPEEIRIMDTIVRSGVTREDYIKQYKQVQGRGRK